MSVPATVWFNKGLSNLYSVFQLIKQAEQGEKFKIFCTHTNPDFIGFITSDEYEVEPVIRDNEEYLSYCLELCKRKQVKIFLPGRKMAFIVEHAQAFADIGTTVLAAADAETLRLIDHKAALYDSLLGKNIVRIPEYTVVRNLADYDAAVSDLLSRHKQICVKPVASVYGLGFRILTEESKEFDRLMNGDSLRIGIRHFRRVLETVDNFRELIVMQYLEGQERSIDCLADNGTLISALIRLKSLRSGGAQVIEYNPEIEQITSDITRLVGLHSMYNVQLKESGGIPYLLEINPRMSGGMPWACLSGVNIPYWAMCLALGENCREDIPQPQTGLRIVQVTEGVLAGA